MVSGMCYKLTFVVHFFVAINCIHKWIRSEQEAKRYITFREKTEKKKGVVADSITTYCDVVHLGNQ